MIAIYLRLGDESTGRITFKKPSIRIGSAQHNDLVLRDGEVTAAHCTLELVTPAFNAPSSWQLVVHAPLTVSGEAARPGMTLKVPDGALLVLGDYTIILALAEPGLSRDPVEARLLAAVLARDEGSRLVYSDWLEENGHADRAEFVRVQEALAGVVDARLAERSRLLCRRSPLITYAWRRRVGRPGIERCPNPDACPTEWGSLEATERPDVRRCETCRQEVTYCKTILDGRTNNGPFVIDLAVERREGDLDPPSDRVIIGRPFEVSGTFERAPLVRRSDWCR